ncbi:ABC transporter, permease protein [Treponema primitia ZAS-2]|uniref:ABC transporter, permease protein n=1 Tax=Treponema primitia (strain ATCC BAA-887 / DSM 12427 / ZAS-2) TaxID=545694 RepID=F5YM75_TREPZ|nr:ABC transporter permease [Treponema primitia]AEF86183.1 ABC transporter, permease protein [Treponema primitia ZAS-2]
MKDKLSKFFVTLTWVILIFFVWEFAAFILDEILHDRMASRILPYPDKIVSQIFERSALLTQHASLTLSRAFLGFIIGAAVGFCLALIMSLAGLVERMLFPYLLVSQMIPILGLAPILIGIIGDISNTRIFIAAFITFFPVATNTLAGFKTPDREKTDLMFSYAANKFTLYTKLMIPAAIPYFFSGLKIAAPMAITAAILVDTLGGATGLGYLITYSLYGGFPIMVFWSSVLVSAALGILSYYAIVLIEKICMPYKYLESAGALGLLKQIQKIFRPVGQGGYTAK